MCCRPGLWHEDQPVPPWEFRHSQEEDTSPGALVAERRRTYAPIMGSGWAAISMRTWSRDLANFAFAASCSSSQCSTYRRYSLRENCGAFTE